MPDISTVWNAAGTAGDWVMAGADLQSGGDLETSVEISLFTDRVADADDVIPDGTDDPRGWVGDADSDRPIGSKLWLLSRADLTSATLVTSRDYALQALQWLLDDGVASTVDVATSIGAPRRLDMLVTVSRTGGPPIKLQFAWAWGG